MTFGPYWGKSCPTVFPQFPDVFLLALVATMGPKIRKRSLFQLFIFPGVFPGGLVAIMGGEVVLTTFSQYPDVPIMAFGT